MTYRCNWCRHTSTSIEAIEAHALTHPGVRAMMVATAANHAEAEKSRATEIKRIGDKLAELTRISEAARGR